MKKSLITKTWIAGLVVFIVGLIIGGVSLGLMLAYGGHFTAAANGNGSNFVPSLDSVFWTTVSVMSAGFLVAAAGYIGLLAAWIGSIVNTYPLQDKTWFIVLLVGGVLGLGFGLLGFAAMLAYLIAGPDGHSAQRVPQSAQPASFVPTT